MQGARPTAGHSECRHVPGSPGVVVIFLFLTLGSHPGQGKNQVFVCGPAGKPDGLFQDRLLRGEGRLRCLPWPHRGPQNSCLLPSQTAHPPSTAGESLGAWGDGSRVRTQIGLSRSLHSKSFAGSPSPTEAKPSWSSAVQALSKPSSMFVSILWLQAILMKSTPLGCPPPSFPP